MLLVQSIPVPTRPGHWLTTHTDTHTHTHTHTTLKPQTLKALNSRPHQMLKGRYVSAAAQRIKKREINLYPGSLVKYRAFTYD